MWLQSRMYTVIETAAFAAWMQSLRDPMTRIRLARRLERASRGQLGDVKAVGGGVIEMREFFGPGWRMYYVERDGQLILMLGGGDKSSQARDIAQARQIAKEL